MTVFNDLKLTIMKLTLYAVQKINYPGYYAPARRKVCVCPSVRPSVAYIANNSRTRRPSLSKFGTKVPHLWCNSSTSFKVKRSKVNATRPINADTHRAPYLPNGKVYELQTWYADGERRPTSATGAMTSKVKVARSRDQSEVSWANAVSVPLAAGRGMPCRSKPAATLLVNHVSCLHMLPIDRARRDEQFELF